MKPSTQPVWVGWAATIVIALAARYGLKLSDEQAAGVALVLGTGVQALVHRYVTPVARPRAADGTPMIKAHLAGPAPGTRYQPPPPDPLAEPRPPRRPLE